MSEFWELTVTCEVSIFLRELICKVAYKGDPLNKKILEHYFRRKLIKGLKDDVHAHMIVLRVEK